MSLHIRLATEKDAERLLAIYKPYVEHTAITFEYTVPTVSEFAERIAKTLCRYPYLIAEENGKIFGYAYAGSFHSREAYDWAVETSIYMDTDQRGRGIGKVLYSTLEKILIAQGFLNMNACLAYTEKDDPFLTNGSMIFHEKLGFVNAGQTHQCGYKFGRWYDIVWMEKHIAPHTDNPAPIKSINEIDTALFIE